ncbi:MAG: hypothetical protein E4H36_02825 [Spirochaetales bacterium]|nr:MAG: hypothetical protein E4H36_02825 [Spirochaetales bacterium]
MTITTSFIVYPEGDIQEIPHNLRVNQVVDINGFPLKLPTGSTKMIAFRVFRVSSEEKTGEVNNFHYLELLNTSELREYRNPFPQ